MHTRRFIFVMIPLLCVIVVMTCGCPNGTQPPGILEGTVTIGPLTPVETPGDKPPVPPEVYESRKVMVHDAQGRALIAQVDIGNDGMYRVELPPGGYMVDINRIGIDSSADVPMSVQIQSGETVRLDIDIDTGIR